MLSPRAILQVANFMRRLYGADAELIVSAEINRREDRGTRPRTTDAWREVLEVLEQPGSFETSLLVAAVTKNRRELMAILPMRLAGR